MLLAGLLWLKKGFKVAETVQEKTPEPIEEPRRILTAKALVVAPAKALVVRSLVVR